MNRNLNIKKKVIIISIILLIVGLIGALVYYKYTNDTKHDNDNFLMGIEDKFTIVGRGTVVTGRVNKGSVKVGDVVQIVGLDNEIKTITVDAIEMYRSEKEYAEAGDNVGIIFDDITRDEVQVGQVLAAPNSISATKKFDADVYVLTQEESGYMTSYISKTSIFYFWNADISGNINSKNDLVVSSGNNVSITATLEKSVAMEAGTEFSIKQNDVVVAKGTVTKVY